MRRQTDARIETTLVAEARLAAELLARSRPADVPEVAELDDEADRLGQLTAARVTFIAADGRVVGDSSEPLAALATMENHALRPEVIDAREKGIGRAQRYSATLQIDMLYIAVPVAHPAIAFVRDGAAADRRAAAAAADPHRDAGGARLRAGRRRRDRLDFLRSDRPARATDCAASPSATSSGDLTPPRLGFGDDELGTVARALDDSVQEVGRRLAEQARDRARMEAMLAGMVEGVIVVDPQGRLQLVNDAAQQMLRLETVADRTAVRRDDPAAGDRGAGRGVLLGRAPDAGAAVAAARSVAHHHGDAPRRQPAPRRTAWSLVLHDITELRRADQIRRDFVANVSHELRTPLTAIRGYVEALSEDDTERRGRRAIPRDHRTPHAADGAAGQGSAAAGAARRRPGDARRDRRAIRATSPTRSSRIWRRRPRNAASASR